MPTNLYGPGDNFDLDSSHVLPALMRKFHDSIGEADPEVVVWGTGSPMREFLHVDDLADACLFLMEHYSDDMHINVGTGVDLSIRELAEKVRDVVNPQAKLVFDRSKPDGTPRKVLDVSRLRNLGWVAHLRPRCRYPQHLRLVRRRAGRRRRTARHDQRARDRLTLGRLVSPDLELAGWGDCVDFPTGQIPRPPRHVMFIRPSLGVRSQRLERRSRNGTFERTCRGRFGPLISSLVNGGHHGRSPNS